MTLVKRVPSFITVDVEKLAEKTANVPEQVSNALYFVTMMEMTHWWIKDTRKPHAWHQYNNALDKYVKVLRK